MIGRQSAWDLSTDAGRRRAHREIRDFTVQERSALPERISLAERLTGLLGDDYAALRAKRILTVMTPEEAAQIAREGVDVELHTHRHRTPTDRALFLREITDNRLRIDPLRTGVARHFCYPSGVYRSEFLPWLREAGVTDRHDLRPGARLEQDGAVAAATPGRHVQPLGARRGRVADGNERRSSCRAKRGRTHRRRMPEHRGERGDGTRPIRVCLVAPSLSILGGQAVAAQRLLERLRMVPGLEVDFLPHDPRRTRCCGCCSA